MNGQHKLSEAACDRWGRGEACEMERRADSQDRSPMRKTKSTIGMPEVQVDHVGGVQRRYVGQLKDTELDERLRRAEERWNSGGKKLLTEAEAVALLQGKRRR